MSKDINHVNKYNDHHERSLMKKVSKGCRLIGEGSKLKRQDTPWLREERKSMPGAADDDVGKTTVDKTKTIISYVFTL